MDMDKEVFNKIAALFPIGSKEVGAELNICNCTKTDRAGNSHPYHEEGELVLHLVVWDKGAPTPLVLDVKEQKINIPATAIEEWDFWWALKNVLSDVLKTYGNILSVLPEDLFKPSWSALGLKTKDYNKALRQKSRLGRYL